MGNLQSGTASASTRARALLGVLAAVILSIAIFTFASITNGTVQDLATLQASSTEEGGWPVTAEYDLWVPADGEGMRRTGSLTFEGESWTSWRLTELDSDGWYICYEQADVVMRTFAPGRDGCTTEVEEETRTEVGTEGGALPHAVNPHFAAGLLESAKQHGKEGAAGRRYPNTPDADVVHLEVRGSCDAGRCASAPRGQVERWTFDESTGLPLHREVGVSGEIVFSLQLRTLHRFDAEGA